VVMFGGTPTVGASFDDTWEWTGTVWIQRTPNNRPDARFGHAMAYDAARGRTMVFSGSVEGSAVDDSFWEWNGEEWSEIEKDGAWPVYRVHSAMAYDSTNELMLLFGGSPGPLDDLWAWDGKAWTEVKKTSPWPSNRSGHPMVFDSIQGTAMLFGGEHQGVLEDLWEWTGIQWVLVSGSGPGRSKHGMSFDSNRGVIVVFGGRDDLWDRLGDTWEWDGMQWSQISEGLGPPDEPRARYKTPMTFDSRRNVSVLFSGFTTTPQRADTWEYGPPLILAMDTKAVCPGLQTVTVTGSTAGGTVAFVYGDALGSTTIPTGNPCAGTTLPIAGNVTLLGSNQGGSFQFQSTASMCGGYVVAIDIETCRVSDPVQIPR
jgi:hypothetical protein